MSFSKLKSTNEFDELLKECLKKKRLSVSWIQKQFKVSFQMAMALYEETNNYNDEVFMHNALYELSFEEEPPTIARIMNSFNVSFLLAKKIFDNYMEVI